VLVASPAWAQSPGQVAPAPPTPAPTEDVFARAASQDPSVRMAAAAELGSSTDPRAASMLLVLLQRDIDPGVRRAAAVALANTREPSYASALHYAARRDPSPQVRDAAYRAYDRLWPLGKRPGTAAGLSILCPGCGKFYLRKSDEGLLYLGTTAALLVGGVAMLSDSEGGGALDSMDDANDPIGLQMVMAAQNLWFYGIFAAYRDARLMRGDEGYRFPVSHESLTDLASAPFRPRVLGRPWVWAGVPAALAAGLGMLYLVAPDDLDGDRSLLDGGGVDFLGRHFGTAPGVALGEAYYGGLFLPVAIGEESLFRGVLQPALSERLGKWGGWATTSVLFGAVHIFNFTQPGQDLEDALIAVPFITVVGSAMGLAYMRNGYQLETSVAMHFWYDFLLSTAYFVADPDNQPFAVRIRFAW